ncbi:Spo0B domain-containing protein [Paenibacillus swuensis]|uniref:Spo0B domain-containing protein n=1 Tax=Paenibacillus swuensis TaxID=1178515 RepID=UPI0008386EE7|nr:Spo0B domain-containing protein [Paenibacillus swuensis]
MNELQVLYGYIRLKKYDSLPLYLDKIRDKMLKESQLSKLGEPDLVLFLHSYRTLGGTMELEVDPEEGLDLSHLKLHQSELGAWITDVIKWFQTSTKPGEDHFHQLNVELTLGNHELTVHYSFSGEIDEQQLQSAMKRLVSEYESLGLRYSVTAQHEEADIAFDVPFHT